MPAHCTRAGGPGFPFARRRYSSTFWITPQPGLPPAFPTGCETVVPLRVVNERVPDDGERALADVHRGCGQRELHGPGARVVDDDAAEIADVVRLGARMAVVHARRVPVASGGEARASVDGVAAPVLVDEDAVLAGRAAAARDFVYVPGFDRGVRPIGF
jgi:hypothetical protein